MTESSNGSKAQRCKICLDIDNVVKQFPGVTAVDQVSVQITEGEIYIDGTLVNDLPPAQRGIAMVFQSYALYPHMTVEENMAFGLKLAKESKDSINEKVGDAAECKEVIEDICGEPAADSRIECHETSDGVECDYPASGVPWDLYDDEGSACNGGKWGSDWCDAVFE